jgi:hypothetical protein
MVNPECEPLGGLIEADERRECTDTRYRHQKTTGRIHPDLLLHRLIEDRDLLAQFVSLGSNWIGSETPCRIA